MGSLKTKLNGLPRLDGVIPASASRGVRIAAGDGGIPGAAQARAARISPIHIPVIDRTGAPVGNPDRSGKAGAPVITDDIGAIAAGRGST